MIDARAVLNSLPVAVYVTDAEGHIRLFNEAAAEMWGRRPEAGETWCGSLRLYWPDGRPMRHEECPMGIALREGRELRNATAILERPDGRRIIFRPYPVLLRDDSGAVTGAVNMLVDVTQEAADDVLQGRLAAIVEGSDDAIVSKTLDGVITSWNSGAQRIFGYTAEEMIGQSIMKLIPPELRSEEEDILARLKRGERIDHFQTVRVAKDGRRINISLTVSPVRDGTGAIVGASKVARDITVQNAHEVAQARLAAIVEGSDDAILSKTLEGIVTSWNGGAERIFGYTAEEMIGQPIFKLIPPELRSEEEEILAKLQRGERIEHFDTIRIGKDGRRIHISLTVSPLRDPSGRIIGASKVARDVTERKRAEEMQRLLFNELNHRVKNMLASIQAIAGQSLRSAAGPDQFVDSFSGRIRAMAGAHDLLVEGRMEGADMFGLVRDQVVLGVPDSRNVSFSGPHIVVEDRAAVQLALVLHELATNARKYGALSRPEGHLSISWRLETAPERALLLEWRETGVGEVKAPSRRGFGTRLIERSLEANGGKAVIHYGADGVRCDIRLPLPETLSYASRLATAAARAAAPHGPHGPQAAPAGVLRGKRVLVIEDEPLIAMEIEAQLIDAGCEVVGPASTAATARRIIEEGKFDLAVVDANLGGEPVGELAAVLSRRNVPFLFATGYGREALPAGFEQAPILTKPFTETELTAALGRLLDGAAGDSTVVPLRPRA